MRFALVLALVGAGCGALDVEIWPDMYFPDDPQGLGFCHRDAVEHAPTDLELGACAIVAHATLERVRARLAASPRLVEVSAADAGPDRDDLRALGAFALSGGGGHPARVSIYRVGLSVSGLVVELVEDRAAPGHWIVERD